MQGGGGRGKLELDAALVLTSSFLVPQISTNLGHVGCSVPILITSGAHLSSLLKQNPMPYVKEPNKPNTQPLDVFIAYTMHELTQLFAKFISIYIYGW